jgi:hypothetical protein
LLLLSLLVPCVIPNGPVNRGHDWCGAKKGGKSQADFNRSGFLPGRDSQKKVGLTSGQESDPDERKKAWVYPALGTARPEMAWSAQEQDLPR